MNEINMNEMSIPKLSLIGLNRIHKLSLLFAQLISDVLKICDHITTLSFIFVLLPLPFRYRLKASVHELF